MFMHASVSHANRFSKPHQQRSFLTSLLQTNNLLALLQRLRRPFKQLLLARSLAALILIRNKKRAFHQGQDLLGNQLVGQDDIGPGGDGLVGGHGQQVGVTGSGADQLDLSEWSRRRLEVDLLCGGESW